ncbi:serine/threonine-protein kinase [Singulisphaera acidiphila]|uniref:Protein kinase family protein n=1 Tax=Singulisphaera acidiphila (strain ATCC BAA-1392 / DSM 18658 / VKM B-2454 / MOB10) TaxID=886293 RepID=L0DJY9_SINAD|nr:serine/threonine-protein kinase [Singulisphaera acidiphila]AGA29160.1 protein kinase family protein [Singulisphaera acidiphila DSM 18658]
MESDREKILDLIVRWEEGKAQGEALAPEELCRDCPQLLTGFRRQVAKLEQVDWLNESIESGTLMSVSASGFARLVPADSSLPRLLADRYRLDSLVGEGGFGRVYKGFDTWLERLVAVKIPRVDRPVTSGEVDQCRIEARKVAQLRHPNIVPVHDVGREGTSCFIVGEWIEGTNLALWIKTEHPDHEASARIVADVADALDHAHRAGFVHRDIKPANILIDLQGKAYLTDFGIAVLEEDLKRNQGGVGTLPYMAPEQLTEELGPIDHRADLYGLGVVLFELLTGRRPFLAGTAIELREQIVNQAPPSLRSIDGSVPEQLERVCLRTLAKRADDRYPRADLLAADLRASLEV